jgi:hypothetical protein
MKHVYIILAGNCDSYEENAGTVAWRSKAGANKAARLTVEELIQELNGDDENDEPMYKMTKRGDRYSVVQISDNYECNWWYVQKMTLRK